MRKRNVNFKALSRSMGVPTSTNKERINYNARGTDLDVDHYRRLLNQKEVYFHPTLKIAVVRTNYNKKIKIIDTVRMSQLMVFNGEYPYLVYEGKAYRVHRIVAESYNNRLIQDNEDVHHCDLNKTNYEFENLAILDREVHRELHNNMNKVQGGM